MNYLFLFCYNKIVEKVERKEKILFLDESGDHDLKHISNDYPIFVLGGCIVEHSYYEEQLKPEVDNFKISFFGSKDIILHTRDITRNKGIFEKLKDKEIRNQFYNKLNKLMANLNYTVIASVIKKKEFIKKYSYPMDPYAFSLEVVIERFIYSLKEDNSYGKVIAESRNKKLDALIKNRFEYLKLQGTRFVSAKELNTLITSLRLVKKDRNIDGLQIADLIVSPIGRFVLGKKTQEDFKIIERKFRRGNSGTYNGYGLVILPK